LRTSLRTSGSQVLALGASLAALGLAACPNPVCKFRGTINQPENLSMRRALLRKGMGDVCKQMTTRSAPLRLSPDSPVIGRYFPQQCTARDDDANLYLQFTGFGYAWTNVTKKMTFTGGGAALYRYDFRVREEGKCDIYAYFRPSRVDLADFRVNRIESGVTSMLNTFTNAGDTFGRQLVSGKLQQGFTVISYDAREDDVDFGLGITPVGQAPSHPYDVHGTDKATYESERVEVHQNQRDFVGPITVEGPNRAIFVTAALDGAPALDVFFVRKEEGDLSLRQTFDVANAVPLAAPPMAADVLQAGVELRRAVPVAPGMYYVIFDNTSLSGRVAPPVNNLDDRAAVINYLIQVGDAS
jgi:hypothetical protein